MNETFEPSSINIKGLFGNTDALYKIPDYQRSYSWTDEEVERMWDDLYTAFSNNKENTEEDENYFLGSIIIISQNNIGYHDVVDGQQRITTLTILFCVFRDMFPSINSNVSIEENPKVIKHNRLISSIVDYDERNRIKIMTHPQSQNDFERFVIKSTNLEELKKPYKKSIKESPTARFQNTAYIFKSKLEELGEEKAGEFLNYIFNNVRVIKIVCSNRSFAIKLFQVLNNRGLDLSQSDLIKSYLMSKLHEDKHSQFIAERQDIEKTVSDVDVSLNDLFVFYEYYLLGANPKKALNEELEKQFKTKDSNEVINDFKYFVNQYKEDIFYSRDKVISSLKYIPWNAYWKSIVLTALHSNYVEVKELIKSIRRFYYLYRIAGKTLTQVKQTSFNIIKAIKEKKIITEINEIINNKLLEDKIFNLVFDSLNGEIYGEYRAKPLFFMLEYNQTEGEEQDFIEWKKDVHLEHILPREYKKFEERGHISDEFADENLNTFGNLTLMSGRKNIQASNNPFLDKINIYEGKGRYGDKKEGITAFRVSEKIINDYNSDKYDGMWTKQSIKDRQDWVLEQIKDILDI